MSNYLELAQLPDGTIVLSNADENHNIISGNYKIISIGISYDFYTYKNMLTLPFNKKGPIDLEISFQNFDKIINIRCSEIEILLKNDPKYVRHIKKME